MAKATGARTATTDYRELLKISEIDAYFISATPESLHYPMARECLLAGKHVFLEKPMAVELHEADELIAISRQNGVKFTIGYSQRFNHKFAYVKKSIADGTIGRPVSALVQRATSRAAWARKSPAGPSSLRLPWKRPTISTSSFGASSRPSRCGCTRRSITAR